MGFHLSRDGFPATPASCLPSLPCRFGLDLLSTGEHREPLGFGIAGGVDIPVMHRATGRTGPFPDRERKGFEFMAAGRTALGTGVPPIDRDQRPRTVRKLHPRLYAVLRCLAIVVM